MGAEMSPAFWVLLDDTQRRCRQASDDLEALAVVPGSGVYERGRETFIRALQLVVEGTSRLLQEQGESFRFATTEQIRSGLYTTVRNVAECLGPVLEGPIQLLRLPRSEQLEVFATPMTRLAKSVVPGAEVLFFPWLGAASYKVEVYNAAVAAKLLPSADVMFERALPGVQFLRLRHPASRTSDIFQHAVFAHEIAHSAIVRAFPAVLRAQLPESEAEVPHTFESAAMLQAPRSLQANETPERVKSWFRELACDIVAMRLIGPAFLVAFAEVTALHRLSTPDGKPRMHPAPELRFEILGQELERFAGSRMPAETRAVLTSYASVHEGTYAEKPPSPITKRWIDEALERFRTICLPTLIDPEMAEYRPATLDEELPVVFEALRAGIYPAELLLHLRDPDGSWSRELDWRSIVNGVLLDHVTRHGLPTDISSETQLRDRRQANEMALGGVELSEIHRRARALRVQANGLMRR